MHTIKINKKQYAVGFWWQILDGKGGRKLLMEQARKVAADFSDRNYNYVIARKQQFALGSSSAKLKKIPSLACALLERSLSTWIGMFCLNAEKSLWWICAVSKKTIVAEGDRVFNSREEAEAHLKNLKSMSDWGKNEFICESFDETLTHFDGLIKASEGIQSLYPPKDNRKVFIFAVAVLLTVAGSGAWNEYQNLQFEEQQRITAIQARKRAEENKASINSDPAKFFVMPWKESSLPSNFAEVFIKAIENTEPFNNGWKLEKILRNDTGIYMAWQHQNGADFTIRPLNATLGASPDVAEITIDYPQTSIRPEQGLISKSEATASLYELTRNLGAKLNLKWKSPEIKTEKNKLLKQPLQIISPWVKGEWTLSALPASAAISQPLFTAMDSLPCLVISQISLTRNQCTIEGQIYATY